MKSITQRQCMGSDGIDVVTRLMEAHGHQIADDHLGMWSGAHCDDAGQRSDEAAQVIIPFTNGNRGERLTAILRDCDWVRCREAEW